MEENRPKLLIIGGSTGSGKSDLTNILLAKAIAEGKKVFTFDSNTNNPPKQTGPPIPFAVIEEMIMDGKIEASPLVKYFRERAYLHIVDYDDVPDLTPPPPFVNAFMQIIRKHFKK